MTTVYQAWQARQNERERQGRERAAQEAQERPQSVPSALQATMGNGLLAQERHKQAEPTVKEFTVLCRKRSLGMAGYRDSSVDWKDTPQQLREQVDKYNAMPEVEQKRVLAEMTDDPAKAKGMADLLRQRTLMRSRDHGLGM